MGSQGPLWVFGYASLIWKVDFPYEQAEPAFLQGYVRRFWQGSTDHRGLPEYPGRVCTLCAKSEWGEFEDPHDAGDFITWGVAYRVPSDKADEVRAHLDYRERGGYSPTFLPVHSASGFTIDNCLVYLGKPDNPNWLGPAPLSVIAHTIATAVGPSGANKDYLLNLCSSMEGLREKHPSIPEDHHLSTLRALVDLGSAQGVRDDFAHAIDQGTICA